MVGRALAVVVGLAVAAAVLDWLGVAGYRLGPLWVTLILAGGGGAAAYFAARPSRRRGWAASAAILVGVLLGSVLVDRAVLSKGELARRLDALELPFFEVASERREGHSWCSPTCPVVTRTYRGPNIGVNPTMLAVATALASERLIPQQRLGTIRNDPVLRVATDRLHVTVEVQDVEDQRRMVSIRYRAIRPAG